MNANLMKLLPLLILVSSMVAFSSETYKAPSWHYKNKKTHVKKMRQPVVTEDSNYAIDEEFENTRNIASDEDEEADYSTREPSSTRKRLHHNKKHKHKHKMRKKSTRPKYWQYDRR